MQNIFIGEKWEGRPYTFWKGLSIRQLQYLIPTFKISEFKIENSGVNEFLSIISRDPLDKIEAVRALLDRIDVERVLQVPQSNRIPDGQNCVSFVLDAVCPQSDLRIPVAAVRSAYTDTLLQSWKSVDVEAGYKLVEHHEILKNILKVLKDFSVKETEDISSENSIFRVSPLTDPKSLEAQLMISKYGARMRIEFLVPNYKFYPDSNKPHSLKVVCCNSTDKSMALRIYLFWQSDYEKQHIPIARFGRFHQRQSLGDEGNKRIKKFLDDIFFRMYNGEWFKFCSQIIDDETVKRLLKKHIDPDDVKKILGKLEEIGKSGVDIFILWIAIMSLDESKDRDQLELPLDGGQEEKTEKTDRLKEKKQDELTDKFLDFIEDLNELYRETQSLHFRLSWD